MDDPLVLEKAAEFGAIDRASTMKEVRGADLVVLAAPISLIPALIGDLAPTDALVTDVASTKMRIVWEAEARGLRFVGGHPMAGSQLSGVANAKQGLFRGARYFLTPTNRTDPEVYRRSPGSFERTSVRFPQRSNPRSTTYSWPPSRIYRTSWP